VRGNQPEFAEGGAHGSSVIRNPSGSNGSARQKMVVGHGLR
jgi:hypothetical protein